MGPAPSIGVRTTTPDPVPDADGPLTDNVTTDGSTSRATLGTSQPVTFVPGEPWVTAQIPQMARPPSNPAAKAIAMKAPPARVIAARMNAVCPPPRREGGQTR